MLLRYNHAMRILFICLLLTGCVSGQERASRHVELFGEYCESLGLKKGSGDFAECVQNEAKRHNA